MPGSDHHTVLSVRGEAERTVAPDQASISCEVSVVADTKSAAAAEATRALTELTDALAAASGAALTVHTVQAPLTWSAHSMHTHPEHAEDEVTGRHGPTGRHEASVHLQINVRDFALLHAVEAVVTEKNTTNVHHVQWSVDHDNPEWSVVRADAIQAALLKGQDYAAALGGSVTSVDHVADAGLLGSDGPPSFTVQAASATMGRRFGGGSDDPAMDPVPQSISAIIEARLTAVIPPLAPR